MVKHSVGNFKNLLLDITLHPSMGIYLSHFNNSKTIPERNIHPDENYAREVLQLFTIGLHQLNIDGTLKLDSFKNPMPTYTQKDIKELAKVFTGLSAGRAGQFSKPDRPVNFGFDRYNTDFSTPMAMFEEWHEFGEKSFLNLYIPSGQKGMKDIEMAIDHIFKHPNVGPFIGKQLIQKLVTSNPSPSYIKKVAETFNNNGQGVRGDMAAVFKAILLHPEARSCEAVLSPTQGKLQEPLVRLFERIRNYKVIPDANNKIFTDGGSAFWNYDQNIMSAPSVFNFYQSTHSNNEYYAKCAPSNKRCSLVVYKPNNPQFAIEGSVKSSDRVYKLKNVTIEKMTQINSDTQNVGIFTELPFILKNKTLTNKPALCIRD
jgi:uncharacterized protein (DUF1800 family)